MNQVVVTPRASATNEGVSEKLTTLRTQRSITLLWVMKLIDSYWERDVIYIRRWPLAHRVSIQLTFQQLGDPSQLNWEYIFIISLEKCSELPIARASDGRANWFDSSKYLFFLISEPCEPGVSVSNHEVHGSRDSIFIPSHVVTPVAHTHPRIL